jgi:phosphohistidine phosphatase SixA
VIFVVRHASAGERGAWDDDSLRPLDARGRRQAEGLVDVVAAQLAGNAVTRVVSSPAVRCRDTVAPLAEAFGLAVEIDARLAEESPIDGFEAVIDELDEGGVVCSHGDMIPAYLSRLDYRGVEWLNPPDPRKAALHVLDRENRGPGTEVRRVWSVAPPR